MQNLKNFQRYHPESSDKKALESAMGVIFLISEDGQDWYECQKNFQLDTMKVEYDADGVIRSMGYDISGFCPEGCSVAEVSEWPKEAAPNRKWCFVDAQVVPRIYTADELRGKTTHKKNYLLEQATKMIAPLQDVMVNKFCRRSKRHFLVHDIFDVALNNQSLNGVDNNCKTEYNFQLHRQQIDDS
ncbi:Caudovirales tail fiber assembly protein, lambda gpK [Arsenophonus nasoniae]|uniref:Caudovirales tail fiber assembly protein, lambda gpK n=2 Tax=Arsenophonus nasoniae TaxID=638 RepID=A0A4P7KXE0_9GAMM|nr:Caudovirales tail fiber assembly protein, lambda gpK [Arsenophonus nasoniae]